MKWCYLCFLFALSCLFSEIVPFTHSLKLDPRYFSSTDAELLQQAYYKNHYKNVTPSTEPLIPKIIHHIWLGSPIPNKYKRCIESWKKHHPDWTVKMWTDKDIFSFPFVTGAKIKKARNPGQRSDIFRYEILNRYGGLYVDTDFFCLKSHDIIHHTCDLYASMNDSAIFNGLMGCSPKHPVVIACLNSIKKETKFSTMATSIMGQTGPHLLTRLILKEINKNPNHKIISYHPNYFYPFPAIFRFDYWDSNQDFSIVAPFITPKAFAVHLWATSWFKGNLKAIKAQTENAKKKYIKRYGHPKERGFLPP